MAVDNKMTTWYFNAKNDLTSTVRGTGSIYKAIDAETGDFASNGRNTTGILYTSAKSGTHGGTYADAGKIKYTAGAAVSSQNTLLSVTTSGYVIAADSGFWVVGKSIGNDVGSGSLGIGHFNFSNPWFAVDCTWLGN